MTEMLAALLGALVGGLLSAWVGSRQTARVLKHETDMAAIERREAQRADESRRRAFAADALISALADFTTVKRGDSDRTAAFVRTTASEEVHLERNARAATLLQASSSYSHALPGELRERWDALIWLVRFGQSRQPERSDRLRRRDASDMQNYIEYMRRSLFFISGDYPSQAHFPAPDVRREDYRIWGFKPGEGSSEPDLTEWQLRNRRVGEVRFTTGEVCWCGPNGQVIELPREHGDVGTHQEGETA